MHTRFAVNSAFANNGGAISAQLVPGLNFTIDHCNFTGNVANVLGGAVYYSYTSTVPIAPGYIVIKDSNFISNHVSTTKSTCGGALTTHCPFDIQSTTFIDNSATGGGAICYLDPERTETASRVIIANSSFLQNTATQLGGAISITGNLTVYPVPWNARLDENLFQSNSAQNGGAIASIGTQFDLNNTKIPNTFLNNRARVGGAFYIRSSSRLLEIGNQTLWSNEASVAGGVVFYEILVNLKVVPDGSYMCKVAECFNNTATAWGPLSATQGLDLTVHHPGDLTNNLKSLVLYPGVEKVIVVEATDQFGQHIDLIPEAYRIQTDLSPGHQPDGRHLRLNSTRILDHAAALQLVIQLEGLSAMLPEPITASIELVTTMESLYPVNKATVLPILVEACGPGYGQDASNPSQCSTCSWMYYSLNGTCSSCAYDSSVSTCSGDNIVAIPNYWVSKNNRTNAYQSIRCPSGFCKGKNECVPGRTGPLCGQCVPGKHESIFTTCTSCNKPNWALIAIAILTLWVVVLIFHSIISVSSGKSSILIFFLSTSFTITYQIPIVDVFSSGGNQVRVFSMPRSLEPFVCLFPMNLLERTLLTAMVPFIMMILITLTFIIHRIVWIIYKLVKRSRGGSSPAVPASEFSLLRPTNAATEAASSDPSKPSSRYGYEVSDYEEEDDGDAVSGDESHEDVGDQRGAPYGGAQETSGLPAEPSSASPLGSSGDDALVFDDEETDILLSDSKNSAFFRELEEKYRWQIENRFFHHYRLIRTLLTLFAATFSLILGTVMATSGCITLKDGSRVLQTAPGISCDSKYFRMWRILYAVFLPYLALVLAAILGKLISAYLSNELSQTDVRFGSWYEMFKPNLFAWKVVEMIRRICILCVGQLLLSDPPTRASLLAITMIGFLTLHLIAMPYRQKLENGLESLSLVTLSVVSLLVYWHSRQRIPYRLPAIFAWSLVILTALLIISGFAAHKLSSSGGFWRKLFRFFSPN
jgi:predicted outer membrane repeat protein